jgi:hypothetical protein
VTAIVPDTVTEPELELASRRRDQAPPAKAVWAALVDPGRDPSRPWLVLLDDEVAPTVLESSEPTHVIWSSLWPDLPHDRIRFDLEPSGAGCALRWTLLTPDDPPDDARIGQLRHRINFLINGELRYSFGQ